MIKKDCHPDKEADPDVCRNDSILYGNISGSKWERTMIEVHDLLKVYGNKTVVNHTTWTAQDGAITGFIGHNGAGKTITLKMITGILKPDGGTVLLNGTDIRKSPLKAKQQFGFVSDSPDHFLRLKGIEYVNFMADMYETPTEGRKEFVEEYAGRLGIFDALNSTILSYSHGMRQKIMILGALIHRPSIWILDEPMLGLDPLAAYELKLMMKEHVEKGNSVLFSTHVLEVAEKLCDEILIIKKGDLQYQGTVEELQAKYPSGMSLEDIFIDINRDDKHE